MWLLSGAVGEWNGKSSFNGYRVSHQNSEKVLEAGGDDGCITM